MTFFQERHRIDWESEALHSAITALQQAEAASDYKAAYAALVTLARSVDRTKTAVRFSIGDVVEKLPRNRGDVAVVSFAEEIEMKPKTAYEYWRMARYYSDDEKQFRERFKRLPWGVLREAMRFEDMGKTEKFLQECIKNKYSVNDAKRLVSIRLGELAIGEKVFEATAAVSVTGALIMAELDTPLQEGHVIEGRYVVRLYRIEGEQKQG